MAKKPADDSGEILILPIQQGTVTFHVIGRTPIILNRMAEKAKRILLMPSGKKTAAEKAGSLKHDPVAEYRASVYARAGDGPTRLQIPAPAFKGAMLTAALDLPGTKRTEIGRLVWVEGYACDLYGVPKLLMSVVRSADMNRTPDIHSRAILPEWACSVTVSFVRPKLNATAIAHLIAAGGVLAGVGDFRQEKGKGNYGQFEIVEESDERYQRIVKTGGIEAQDRALEDYECFDHESAELLDWYQTEVQRRGQDAEGSSKRRVSPKLVAAE